MNWAKALAVGSIGAFSLGFTWICHASKILDGGGAAWIFFITIVVMGILTIVAD